MSSRKTALAIALGLVCGIAPAMTAYTQDTRSERGKHDQNQARGRESGSEGDSHQIDQALKSYNAYRERFSQNAEETRKDVEKTVKELNDLIAMRYQMMLSLAECRAEHGGFQGGPGGFAGGPLASQGSSSGDSGHRHHEALIRELRTVQSQLRGELERERGQADGVAAQLQNLRDQASRMKEAHERAHRGQGSDSEHKGGARKDQGSTAPKIDQANSNPRGR
jgi:hypothetical protein